MDAIPQVDLALFDLHGGIGAVKEGVWSLK